MTEECNAQGKTEGESPYKSFFKYHKVTMKTNYHREFKIAQTGERIQISSI